MGGLGTGGQPLLNVRQNLPNKGDSGGDDMAAPMGNGSMGGGMGNGSMGGGNMGGGAGGNSNALQSALQVIAGLVGNQSGQGMRAGNMGAMGREMDVGAVRQSMSSSRGSDSVVVKTLPYDCNWMLLRDKFGQAGRVTYSEKTGNGVGLIKFSNELEAERAVKLLDNMVFDGRTMKVSLY